MQRVPGALKTMKNRCCFLRFHYIQKQCFFLLGKTRFLMVCGAPAAEIMFRVLNVQPSIGATLLGAKRPKSIKNRVACTFTKVDYHEYAHSCLLQLNGCVPFTFAVSGSQLRSASHPPHLKHNEVHPPPHHPKTPAARLVLRFSSPPSGSPAAQCPTSSSHSCWND